MPTVMIYQSPRIPALRGSAIRAVADALVGAYGLRPEQLAYPSYLMGPMKYREQITAEKIAVVDAHVAVPQGPGLGIEVDTEAIRHLEARTR